MIVILLPNYGKPLSQKKGSKIRVDLICDNSGTELLMDLLLVDFLLKQKLASCLYLHLKAYPTFVSDATKSDLEDTLQYIEQKAKALKDDGKLIYDWGQRLRGAMMEKRLILCDDTFWNSSNFFLRALFPDHLAAVLDQSDFIILKGDANYRRVLCDHCWDTTVSFTHASKYFPRNSQAVLVCLRTLKSDAIVGLGKGIADSLTKLDSQWRVNGKRGVVQASISQISGPSKL